MDADGRCSRPAHAMGVACVAGCRHDRSHAADHGRAGCAPWTQQGGQLGAPLGSSLSTTQLSTRTQGRDAWTRREISVPRGSLAIHHAIIHSGPRGTCQGDVRSLRAPGMPPLSTTQLSTTAPWGTGDAHESCAPWTQQGAGVMRALATYAIFHSGTYDGAGGRVRHGLSRAVSRA